MDDSKCDVCQGDLGGEVDLCTCEKSELTEEPSNVLKMPNIREGLTQLIENTVGKQFLVGFVDTDGTMRYTIGDDLTTADLLMLLEHIKMTFVYGID